MDTTAKELIEDLNAILNDFKMDMVESYDPDAMKFASVDIEEKVDSLIKEVNGLFDSAYL
jgi:hypothetical protein|tara:strand:+ start:1203 stop:1382 length:180 start_codon:yes stop_codon:yes gene_type:complete